MLLTFNINTTFDRSVPICQPTQHLIRRPPENSFGRSSRMVYQWTQHLWMNFQFFKASETSLADIVHARSCKHSKQVWSGVTRRHTRTEDSHEKSQQIKNKMNLIHSEKGFAFSLRNIAFLLSGFILLRLGSFACGETCGIDKLKVEVWSLQNI